MAFWSSSIGFPGLTTKSTPVDADLVLLADSASSPPGQLVQATVGSLPGGGGGGSAGVYGPVVAEATDGLANLFGSTSYYNGPANDGVGATITNTGANVAFTLDGVTFTGGERVLIPLEDNNATPVGYENGIYTVTTVGDDSTPWVITRATDADTAAKIVAGGIVNVLFGGQVYGLSYSYFQNDITTMGTDDIVFQYGFFPIVSPPFYSSGLVAVAQNNLWESGNVPLPFPIVQQELYYPSGVPLFSSCFTAPETTLATGTLYFTPIIVKDLTDIYQISVWSGVQAPANNICLGLYNLDPTESKPTGLPLATSGSILMDSNPIIWGSYIPVSNGPGVYWLAYTIDGGTPSFFYNTYANTGAGSQIILYFSEEAAFNQTGFNTGGIIGFSLPFSYSETFPDLTSISIDQELYSNTAAQIVFGYSLA